VEVHKVVAPDFLGKFWTPERERKRERPKKEAVSGGRSFRSV
jgi:hypothetical protein